MEQFNLKWNNYFNQISNAFITLLDEEDLVDVTLSCEGKKLKAHKMLLSACSSYFREVFKENPCQHPVIVFRNVPFLDLSAILEFIYKGEVSVAQEQLNSFLVTAELLEIKGLTDNDKTVQDNFVPIKAEPVTPQLSRPVEKRKTSQNLMSSSKPVNPPLKKRKPANSVKSPEVPVSVVKVEHLNYKKDVNLELDSDNLARVTQGEFDEGSSKVLEPEIDSELLSEVVVQGVEFRRCIANTLNALDEESEAPVEKIGDPKQEENVTQVTEKPVRKALKPALKSQKEGKQEAVKKSVAIKEPAQNKPLKPTPKEVNLPKGLSVTVRPVLKEQNLIEPVGTEEDNVFLCSEETKTPVDEDLTNADEASEDPVSGEPVLEEPEEPREPEFDYYGCEVCQVEARPVTDKLVLTHKCPICPCVCFCAHLLKEHMRVIHGWFNVQRRYTQY